MDVHIRLVRLPEWRVDVGFCISADDSVLNVGDDADDLDVAWSLGVMGGHSYVLAYGVTVWPKALGGQLVNDRDKRCFGVSGLARPEETAAHQRDAQCLEVVFADNVV